VHAQFSLPDRNLAGALVALERDGAQVPARFAGFRAVIDQGFDVRKGPDGFLDLAFADQFLGEEHGCTAGQIDEIVLGECGQRLTRRHGWFVREGGVARKWAHRK